MKKLLFVLGVLLSVSVFAQKGQKFGHINSNELLVAMPENTKAREELEKYSKDLESQLMAMQTEYQQKLEDYRAKQETASESIRQMKESELNDLSLRIQSFQQTAQQDLQQKELDLLKPIIEKARNAIRSVSKEKGYTYVFDTSTGALAFWPEKSDDLLPLVKAKLNIK